MLFPGPFHKLWLSVFRSFCILATASVISQLADASVVGRTFNGVITETNTPISEFPRREEFNGLNIAVGDAFLVDYWIDQIDMIFPLTIGSNPGTLYNILPGYGLSIQIGDWQFSDGIDGNRVFPDGIYIENDRQETDGLTDVWLAGKALGFDAFNNDDHPALRFFALQFFNGDAFADNSFSPLGNEENLKRFEFVIQESYVDQETHSIMFNTIIAGTGSVFNASAVPIPATAWLFGSALLGLVGLKRKR